MLINVNGVGDNYQMISIEGEIIRTAWLREFVKKFGQLIFIIPSKILIEPKLKVFNFAF